MFILIDDNGIRIMTSEITCIQGLTSSDYSLFFYWRPQSNQYSKASLLSTCLSILTSQLSLKKSSMEIANDSSNSRTSLLLYCETLTLPLHRTKSARLCTTLVDYIKRSILHGLLPYHCSDVTHRAFSDIDRPGSNTNRCSTEGFLIYIVSIPLCGRCKKKNSLFPL